MEPGKLDNLINEMQFLNSDRFAESLRAVQKSNQADIAHLEKLITLQFENLSKQLLALQTSVALETTKREADIKALWDARDKDRAELAEVKGKLGVVAVIVAAAVSTATGLIQHLFTKGGN